RIWECVVAASSFISTLLVMFQVYFDTSYTAAWGIQYFMDVVYLLNIFSRFYIGLESHGVVITDAFLVRKRYLQGWFHLDTISTLPFELITMAYPPEDMWKIIALCRVNRLLRIFRFFSFISSCSQEPGVSVCLAIVKYICIIVICVHTFGCIWYGLVCSPTHRNEARRCTEESAWPELLHFINQSITSMSTAEAYVVCIYWSAVTLTSIGYGDIHAFNNIEVLLSILTMLIGFSILLGVVTSGMSSIITNLDARRGRYYHRFNTIKRHMNDIYLPDNIQNWVMNYYAYLWKHRKGSIIKGLLDDLPFSMYSDITVACNRNMLKKVVGDTADDKIATLLPGYLIGEMYLLCRIPRNVTISTASVCEISVLERKELLNLFSDYPEAFVTKEEVYSTSDNLLLPLHHVPPFAPLCFSNHVIISPNNTNDHDLKTFSRGVSSFATFSMKRVSLMGVLTKGFTLVRDLIISEPCTPGEIFKKCSKQTDTMENSVRLGAHKFKGNLMPLNNLSIVAVKISGEFKIASKALGFTMPESFLCCIFFFQPFWKRTIPPDSKFIERWEDFVVFCQTLTIFLQSWVLFYTNNLETIGFSNTGTGGLLLSVVCIVDVIFFVDIIIHFRVQVPSKDGNLSDFKSILRNYIRSWELCFDIISVFPLDLFSFVYGDDRWQYMGKLRSNRLLWIRKVVKYLMKYEDNVHKNLHEFRLIKCILLLLLSTHICAGIFYLSACFYSRCDPGSWYLTSLYWAASTLTGTGYGDIVAYNLQEQITAIFTCILGMFIYNYIVSQIAATLASANAARVAYQNRLTAVSHFMKQHKISELLQKRVIDYMSLLWEKYQGQAYPGGSYLMWDLPTELQRVIIKADRGKMLVKIPYFEHTEEGFIVELAKVSKVYFYPRGEMIQYSDTLTRELFCICKGTCEILSNDLLYICGIYKKGMYFGETGFLFGKPAVLTVRARTYCEILVLDYDAAEQVFIKFPSINCQMKALQNTSEYYDALVKYMHCLIEKKSVHLKEKENVASTGVRNKCKSLPRNLSISNRIGPSYKMGGGEGLSGGGRGVLWTLNGRTMQFLCRNIILMRCAILPSNFLYVTWEIFRIILAIAISIVTSLQFSFLHMSIPLWIISYILGIFCWVDIYIRFHVAYYQGHKLITNTWKTTQNYLKNGFVIDFISCFPWESLAWIGIVSNNLQWESYQHDVALHLYAFCRIPHLLQLYRVPLAYKYWQSGIASEKTWIMCVFFLIYSVLFIHFCTCIVWITACAHVLRYPLIFTSSSSWLLLEMKTTMSFKEIYVVSLYFAGQTIFGIGYGEFYHKSVVSIYNEIITTLLMIAGAIFYSWIGGTVASIFSNAEVARVQFTERYNSIKRFLKNQDISGSIYENTLKFYEYKWIRTKGTEPGTLLEILPSTLLGDISTSLYAELISKVFFFFKQRIGYTQKVMLQLKKSLMYTNDIIVQRNDFGSEMFFIEKGTVEILAQDEQQVLLTLKPGQYFGESSLIFYEQWWCYYRAATNCDLYILERKGLDETIKYYPDVYTEIKDAALTQHELIRKMESQQTVYKKCQEEL
uniref:Cyclic nucleotide-binding domain-containing protein n=1 Tax=Latimeria chalumnae TaxID=7897 RepID=H3BE11_LATCH